MASSGAWRRTLKILGAFFLTLTVPALMGPRAALAVEELYIMSKPGYHPPAVVAEFEKRHGVRIRFEFFNSSEEAVARLNAGSRGDLFMVRGYAVPDLVKENKIAALDHSLLPGLSNLWDRSLHSPADPGGLHSVPFIVGTMGIAYRQDLLRNFEPSWSYLFNPKLRAAPFSLLDYYRDTMGAALIHLKYSYNTQDPEELSAAANVLTQTTSRPAFMGFMDGPHALEFILEGFICAAVVFNNAASVLAEADPRVDYITPAEGSIMWAEHYVISNRSQRRKLAHQWLNYILEPAVGAAIADYTHSTSPNQAARPHMSPVTRQNQIIYPSERVWENTQVPQSVGPATNLYLEHWSRLKKM